MAKGYYTKNQIMDTFMELMQEKSFNEISVSEITEKCEISRLTFYYHFHDKYDLLNQTVDLMVLYPLKQGLTKENWAERLKYALKTIKEHEIYSYNALLNDNGEFMDHVGKVLSLLFQDVIISSEDEYYIYEEDILFVSKFLSHGVAGCINDWIKAGMKQEPEILVKKIERIINNKKYNIIKNYILETTKKKDENKNIQN